MNHRSTLLLFVGALAVLAAGSSWWVRSQNRKAEGAAVSYGADTEGPDAELHDSRPPNETQGPDPSTATGDAEGERVALAPRLSGRVELGDPSRRQSAAVLVCAAGTLSEPNAGSRPASEWESFVRSVASAALDSESRFSVELDEDTAPSPRRLVYLIEPHHHLAWSEQNEQGRAVELVAASAKPVAVKVLAAGEGEPEGDATVHALYSIRSPKDADPVDGGLSLPFAYAAGPGGLVSIARGGDEVALWAVAGERRSAEWRGSLEDVDEITLDLSPTFSASGSLEGIRTVDPRPSRVRVTAFRDREGERQRLGTCSADADGHWNLPALATDGVTDVVFRLEGEGLSTREETVAAPQPGSEMSLSFDLIVPQRLIVVVQDFDENPVPGARLRLSWIEERATVFSSSFLTDEEGIGDSLEAPAGEYFVRVEKEGWSGGRFGPKVLDEASDNQLTLFIGRAGTIAGRCLREGEPVSEFTLRYWKDAPWNPLEQHLTGREDGSFLIEDAPLGVVQLLASSPDCPGAPLETVQVVSGQEAWVEIELPVPGTAMGRVVDFNTGAPVSAAVVQVLSTATDEATWPWGEPVEVNSQGEFLSVPVVLPLTKLEVSAPGYARVEVRAEAQPDQIHDCETIALPKAQELVLRLIGMGNEDFGEYSASVSTISSPERLAFDRDGVARFASASSGLTSIAVSLPNSTALYVTEFLEEGGDWTVEIPLDTGKRVTVEVRGVDGTPSQEAVWVGITYAAPGGADCLYYERLDEAGQATFTCADTGHVVIDVLDSAFGFLAAKLATLDSSGSTHVVIDLDDSVPRVRLLDTDGNPMASTRLMANPPGNPFPLGTTFVTDKDGVVDLRGCGAGTVVLNVTVPEGKAPGIPVDLRVAGENPTDVVVDVSGLLDLTIRDGDEPLSGVWLHLSLRRGGPVYMDRLSDDQGLCDIGSLTPGEYIVHVAQPGYWPAELAVEAREDRPEYVLQVRRRGSVTVRARRDGRVLSGAVVDLVSDEFGESVSDWVLAQKVTTSTSSTSLDGAGELVIIGIPHGSYTWHLRDHDSSIGEGRVVVPPHGMEMLFVEF